MGLFGEKIDEYEILEHLGKGGFANVYRARCLRSGCFVAIKMIDKARMANAGMVGRVRQEVTIHSRLKHPAILELYTFFEDAHYVYLVLELAHNGELAKHFQLGTRGLSEKAAADIFKQVVSGVTYLHSHNILHRDLSLNNLLLTKDLQVKIADFGLATQLNAPDEKHVTMCGTPNYISPEVASRNFHGLPADVWGLGCMLYTLLVGSPPFHTQNVKSTLNRVINADYKIPTDLSLEAQDILLRLLCKEPSRRISLKEIIDHPFLNMHFDDIVNTKQDMSRDSGFHTTLHSIQHARNRVDNHSTASAKADFCQYNRNYSVEHQGKKETRPASFNVLMGIHDSVSHSTHSNTPSCYILDEGQHCATDYSQNTVPAFKKTLTSEGITSVPVTFSRDPKSHDENKENNFIQQSPACSIGVPPLCADRLPTVSHRTRNALLKIQPESVSVEFIKKKGKDREERITEICRISKDGMKIMVYLVDGGKGRLVSSDVTSLYTPAADEIFTYHNLPQKHWKKYLYAARFVDLVKAKTPKITLYTELAKCQLMENGTDFEMFFYSGEKLTFSSADGLSVIDSNSKTHYNPSVTIELRYIFDHFEECSNKIKRIEECLSSIPDECFPLIIGKRPTHWQNRQVTQTENIDCKSYNSPAITMGSFCHGSSKVASDYCNTPQNNIHSGQSNQNGQSLDRRLPLQLQVNLANLRLR